MDDVRPILPVATLPRKDRDDTMHWQLPEDFGCSFKTQLLKMGFRQQCMLAFASYRTVTRQHDIGRGIRSQKVNRSWW